MKNSALVGETLGTSGDQRIIRIRGTEVKTKEGKVNNASDMSRHVCTSIFFVIFFFCEFCQLAGFID